MIIFNIGVVVFLLDLTLTLATLVKEAWMTFYISF